MSVESLAICLSPNLIRHEDDSTFLSYQRSAQTVFHSLCNLRKKEKLEVYVSSRNETNDNENDKNSNNNSNVDVVDMSQEYGGYSASTAIEEENKDESNVITNGNKQTEEEKGDKPDGIDLRKVNLGYDSQLRHKRKRRRSSIVYESSVHELYRPSLNTGIFGAAFYPKRQVYKTIRRESTLHTKEVVYQAVEWLKGQHFCFLFLFFIFYFLIFAIKN